MQNTTTGPHFLKYRTLNLGFSKEKTAYIYDKFSILTCDFENCCQQI